MTLIDLFERVNIVASISQRAFIDYYINSVNELMGLYGEKYVIQRNKEFDGNISDIRAENVIMPLYDVPTVDNILYCITGNQEYKSEFLRKADEAYRKYWRDGAKRHPKIRKRGAD